MNTKILNRALANAFTSDDQRKAAFAKMHGQQRLDTRGPGAALAEDGIVPGVNDADTKAKVDAARAASADSKPKDIEPGLAESSSLVLQPFGDAAGELLSRTGTDSYVLVGLLARALAGGPRGALAGGPRGALAGVQQGRTLRVLDDITIEEQRAMEAAQAREFATRPSRYSFDSPDPEFFRWYEYGGKARPKPLSDAELQAYMNNRTEHLLNRAAIVIANAITSPAQRRAMFAKAGNTTAATSPKTLARAGTVQTDRGMVRAQEVPFIEPMPPGSRGRMEQMPTVLPPGTRPPTIQPPATAIRLPGAPSGSGAVHADETPPRTGGTRRLPGAPSSSGATHADDVGRKIAQAFAPVYGGGGAIQPPKQQGPQQPPPQTSPLLAIPDEHQGQTSPADSQLAGSGKTFMKPGGRPQAATPQRGIDDMKNPGGRNKRISSLLDLADSTGPKKKKV